VSPQKISKTKNAYLFQILIQEKPKKLPFFTPPKNNKNNNTTFFKRLKDNLYCQNYKLL